MGKKLLILIAAIAIAVVYMAPATAQERPPSSGLVPVEGAITELSTFERPAAVVNGAKLVSVIIKLDEDSAAAYEGDIAGLAATSPTVTGEERLDANDPAVTQYVDYLEGEHAAFEAVLESSIGQAQVTQSFELVVGGVSALIPENQIDAVAALPGVEAVWLDELHELQTEVSPQFIGADGAWADLGGQSQAGEGVIVAVIDSGIWPEHSSFSDPDPFGNSYPAPPAGWAGSGVGAGCDFGNVAFNPADAPFTCNNKLLGAYNFTATYTAVIGLLPTEYDSARDSNGHGSHTLGTAAGNGGVAASIYGIPRGTISGVAPRAHVAAYKGCGAIGCFGSDTAAAIQQAVADGVDVIGFSISGGGSPYSDIVSLAMLDAYNAGTLVVPSAGNSGPGPDTVAHREPWAMTVGASTTDRHFISTINLSADNGDTLQLSGASVTPGIGTPTPVIFPPAGEELCLDPFLPGTFSGEIVICDRGVIARVAKSFNVGAGGAGGLLLANVAPQGLSTDNHFIPSVHLENNVGDQLKTFVAGHTGVTATFTQGVATAVQGDVMAPFSSRGGPGQTLGISKPDVTAPGVQILAAMTPTPEDELGGLPGQLFQSIQGTSMSAPHGNGVAALVKAAHPDWGPGQIKSAIMMTAKTAGVVKEDGSTQANAFDYGSGRVLPAAAFDATVTISETGANFAALENSLWDANYPSLYVPVMAGEIDVQRTFHNETSKNQRFDVSVDAPSDLIVEVGTTNSRGKFKTRKNIKVRKNADQTFTIHVDAREVPLGETRMATIWFDNKKTDERLHFPVTIVRNEAAVTVDKTCGPDPVKKGDSVTCEITIANSAFADANMSMTDKLPKQLQLDKKSVVGGTTKNKEVQFAGTLAAATPPAPAVAVDPLASPFGYVPLSGFGIAPIGASDESIANFGVPPFTYAGETYNQVGFVSNGYAVVGGGTGADIDFINTDLPDPAVPNNVLAPFWTDLNPAAGGAMRIGVLSDGTDSWIVLDWEGVPNFGGGPNDFQIWLGVDGGAIPGEDISFTYGPTITAGDGGFLTVGAENRFGNEGGTVYFNGAGTPPSPSFPNGTYEVGVFSTPGAPGGTATITFEAKAKKAGEYWNYARVTSDQIAGTAIDGAHGTIVK